VPARGSLGYATSRAKQGDFGTPEKPLELIGVPSERESGYRDLSGIYEQRRDSEEAANLERRARTTMDKLAKHGHTMDKQTYSELQGRAKMDLALSQDYKKRVREREKSLEDELKSASDLTTALTKIVAREEEAGKRQVGVATHKNELKKSLYLYRAEANSLPSLYKIAVGHTSPARRAEAMGEVAQILKDLENAMSGRDMPAGEADQMVKAIMAMDDAQRQRVFSELAKEADSLTQR
jgi:phosphohistidine phosphatase SixA